MNDETLNQDLKRLKETYQQQIAEQPADEAPTASIDAAILQHAEKRAQATLQPHIHVASRRWTIPGSIAAAVIIGFTVVLNTNQQHELDFEVGTSSINDNAFKNAPDSAATEGQLAPGKKQDSDDALRKKNLDAVAPASESSQRRAAPMPAAKSAIELREQDGGRAGFAAPAEKEAAPKREMLKQKLREEASVITSDEEKKSSGFRDRNDLDGSGAGADSNASTDSKDLGASVDRQEAEALVPASPLLSEPNDKRPSAMDLLRRIRDALAAENRPLAEQLFDEFRLQHPQHPVTQLDAVEPYLRSAQ